MSNPGSLGTRIIRHPKNGSSVISQAIFPFYGAGLHPFPNAASNTGRQPRLFWQQEFNLPSYSNTTADTISNGILRQADENIARALNGRKFIVRLDANKALLPVCFWFSQETMSLAAQMPSVDLFWTQTYNHEAEAIRYKNLFKHIIGYGRILSMNEHAPIIQFEIDVNQEANNSLGEALFKGGADQQDVWINWSETSEFEINL